MSTIKPGYIYLSTCLRLTYIYIRNTSPMKHNGSKSSLLYGLAQRIFFHYQNSPTGYHHSALRDDGLCPRVFMHDLNLLASA